MTLSESFQTDKVPSTFPSKFPSLVEEERVITSNEKEASSRERIDDEAKRFIEASGEMIREKVRVEKEARARERIDDEAKRFENNLKFGENQVIEASGYAEITKYTMVTLGLILIMMMYHVVFDDDFSTVQRLRTEERPPFWEKLVRDNTENFGIVDPTQRPSRDLDWSNLDWFEGAKVLAKKRQMDEVPEGDPVEGPTSILNEKTTRQQLAKKVRFIDEVDVKNAKKVQAGSGRRTELPISKETRVAPSAPNVHSEERGTAQETAQDISFEDNQPSSATDNILDIADLATAGLRRSGRSRKQKVIYDPSSSDGTFSKALAAISSLLTDHRSKVLMYTYYHRPRTKHIALKYHHFQSWIKSGKCTVLPIDTKEQIADQFTKGLGFQTFAYLRKQICGW